MWEILELGIIPLMSGVVFFACLVLSVVFFIGNLRQQGTHTVLVAVNRYNDRFKDAARMVYQACGTCDLLLADGGLSSPDSVVVLEKATGQQIGKGWSGPQVQDLAQRAVWPVEGNSTVLSARYFLDTCAQIGTGIRVSMSR